MFQIHRILIQEILLQGYIILRHLPPPLKIIFSHQMFSQSEYILTQREMCELNDFKVKK